MKRIHKQRKHLAALSYERWRLRPLKVTFTERYGKPFNDLMEQWKTFMNDVPKIQIFPELSRSKCAIRYRKLQLKVLSKYTVSF
jgi:hypothetical protein